MKPTQTSCTYYIRKILEKEYCRDLSIKFDPLNMGNLMILVLSHQNINIYIYTIYVNIHIYTHTPKFNSLPLKNDGTGRRSFPFGMANFQWRAVRLPVSIKQHVHDILLLTDTSWCSLTPPKTNMEPDLKMDPWKSRFLLETIICRFQPLNFGGVLPFRPFGRGTTPLRGLARHGY